MAAVMPSEAAMLEALLAGGGNLGNLGNLASVDLGGALPGA